MTSGFIWKLFKRVSLRSPSPSPDRPPILIRLPAEILELVLEILLNLEATGEPYDHEICSRARFISLSETCRSMRARTLPWIFREVYNWGQKGSDIWPDTLWHFFSTVHIRDRSVRHPAPIPLPSSLHSALPMMSILTKVTIRLEAAVPFQLLSALSSVRSLSVLEIHQARFDGPIPPIDFAFLSLSSLLIRTCGFKGVARAPNIDHAAEKRNVAVILRNLARGLTNLCISGDFLLPEFREVQWPRLQRFTITEHTPTPFIPVPELIAQMPALRDLSILFTADLTRDRGSLFPPFRLGITHGELLTYRSPYLSSVSLSNLGQNDPIFQQLPDSLESLHLLAMQDLYVRGTAPSNNLGEARFTDDMALIVLANISHLDHLANLSLTLDKDPPSPEFIRAIASKFPKLRCLQLGYFVWRYHDLYLIDLPDEAIFDALRQFQHLSHLKFSLDVRTASDDRGPPANAAYRLIKEVPGLQIVSYRCLHLHSAAPEVWHTWDRSLLLHPPPLRVIREHRARQREPIYIPL